MCYRNEEWCKSWWRIDLPFQNWHEEFNEFWPKHLKISKFFILTCSFWSKHILFELKMYRGVIFHETEEGCKLCRGIDFSFQNWHEAFDEFSPKHLTVSKHFILTCSFWAKHILFELKNYRGAIFHETEEGYKIWRGMDFQNWHKEFDKFWPECSEVSKTFPLMGSFWAKYILFELKKYRGVIFHKIDEGCKIWMGIDLSFQNWHNNLSNFDLSTQKSKQFSL